MVAKLARCNEYMFKKVKCYGYLQKVKDGKMVAVDKDGNAEYVNLNEMQENGMPLSEPVKEYDGAKEFLKTYYKVSDREFIGMVVGLKMITLTGYLTVDVETNYDGSGRTVVEKVPNEQMKCAVVFYGCNRSSLVPLDKIEILNDFE